MQLAPGDRLGPYAIIELLGAGGMGAVYRARDSRLERDVAIKVLQSRVLDADREQRFIREAKTVSALSHPNIVSVYDIGTESGTTYMVMELVSGQPLDTLISASGLRLPAVLRIGAQIADACAAAHASGIIHRDLKPSNVIVHSDGRVRILDFGIAKLVEQGDGDALSTAARTTETTPGIVLGTPAYMSPEQAEGKPLDARSDIFSLGAVLYEMSTGQRAFRGESPISVMAAVLHQEPRPPADLRQELPIEFARLVMRCLRKDPARRVQSMADLKVALEELREDVDAGRLGAPAVIQAPRERWRPSPWTAIAVATIVAAALALTWRAPSPPPTPEETPQPVPLTGYSGAEIHPSLSPDGNQVAFAWTGEQQKDLDIYVALVAGGPPLRLTNDPLPDTGPKWSPDGRHIAFLRRVDREAIDVLLVPPLGGPERRIGHFNTGLFVGGSIMASLCWSPDSRYLFVSAAQKPNLANQILRVALDSGEVASVLALDAGDDGFVSPALSPDGRTLATVNYRSDEIQLVSLSPEYEPLAVRKIATDINVISLVWTVDGHDLILTSDLGGQPLYRLPVSGGTVTRLAWVGPGAQMATVHRNRMVFVRSLNDTNIIRVALDTIRTGTPVLERIASSSFRDVAPHYSPDGTRVAFYSNRGGSIQIWTANADGSLAAPLTSMDPLATTGTPRWSPDGKQIAFDSNAGGGRYHIYVVNSDGGRPRALTSGETGNFVSAWSPDGQWIYFSSDRSGQDEIWRVAAAGGTAEQVTDTGGAAPAISPDGRWLYFTRGDGTDGLWRMLLDGGEATRLTEPLFRNNFVVRPEGIYYVTRGPQPAVRFLDLTSGNAHTLLAIDRPVDLGLAVSPDGKFLLFTQVDYAGQDLMLVENFK